MKRSFRKTLLWLYVLPAVASLFMTAMECILTNQFYEWFWIPEWLCDGVGIVAYYAALLALFLTLGVTGCIMFYQKWQKGLLCSLLPLSLAVVPILRYLIRHIFFQSTASVDEMMYYFFEDTSASMYLLVCGAIALVILWAVKGVCALGWMKLPENSTSVFSPKHPLGLAALIFFGGLTAVSSVYFTVVGEYGRDNFLSLGLELLINTAGYFAVCFGGFFLFRGAKKDN